MSDWVKAAEGTSFATLSQTIDDMNLPKGTKLKIVMDVGWFDWVFNAAGAELPFEAAIPDGVRVIDVYGEDGQGIVDMEVTAEQSVSSRISIWPLLGAILAFIGQHWLAITLIGIALATIVSFIIVWVKFPVLAAGLTTLIVVAGIGVLALIALSYAGASVRKEPSGVSFGNRRGSL